MQYELRAKHSSVPRGDFPLVITLGKCQKLNRRKLAYCRKRAKAVEKKKKVWQCESVFMCTVCYVCLLPRERERRIYRKHRSGVRT